MLVDLIIKVMKKGRQKVVYVVKSDSADPPGGGPPDSIKESKDSKPLSTTSTQFVSKSDVSKQSREDLPPHKDNRNTKKNQQYNQSKYADSTSHKYKDQKQYDSKYVQKDSNYGYGSQKDEQYYPYEEQKAPPKKKNQKARNAGPNKDSSEHDAEPQRQEFSGKRRGGANNRAGNQTGRGKKNQNNDAETLEEIPKLDNRTSSVMTATTEGSEIDFNQADLAEILQEKLTSGKIECAICYNNIRPDASIWNCKRCHGPFHLRCIKQWVENNPINKQEEKKQGGQLKFYMWTCPKCNYCYSEEMPVYKCYCGKVQNPEHDSYSTPHSCGDICGKLRGASCVHPCNLQCHPGPCPPCNLLGKTKTCYCGKKRVQVKCSEPDTGIVCGDVCEKTLGCKKHKCSLDCHEGPCPPCKETQLRTCFCGKEERALKCGIEVFSCEKICGKPLNCGNHKCVDICHDGPCKTCPYTPDKLKTCPCKNQLPLSALGAGNRKSCLDPIPSCGLPCGKKLPCGHMCKSLCHVGDCPDCKELVEQQCRCEKSKRKIECCLATHGTEEDRIFTCERVCKKMKSCGVHKCNTTCCNAVKGNDPDGRHLCVKTCEKPLSCGKHTCDLFCHLGNCPPCPVIINQPLSCTCGAAVKNPPLQCGTPPPSCVKPCSRPRPCGHPCLLKCHYDPCPPCHELVEKTCNCGRSKVKNVKCCMEVLCGKPCDNVFACGHECGVVCHKGECDWEKGKIGCGKRCSKLRVCGHPCAAPCHPDNPCPTEKCKVEIRLVCECGNRETFVPCGATHKLEHKSLRCDKTCLNTQRFGALFAKGSSKKVYYPANIVRIAKADVNFLLKVEAFIEKFLKEGKKTTTFPLHDRNPSKKTLLQVLLSKHYKLGLEFHLNYANPVVIITSSDDTIIPNVKLSEYLKKIEKKEIVPEILPFEASLRFFNLTDFDSLDELESLLKDYEGHFYIEKVYDKNIMVHFWEKEYAESAVKKLKKSQSNFANVSLEENEKLKVENESLQHVTDDVVVDDEKSSLEERKQGEGNDVTEGETQEQPAEDPGVVVNKDDFPRLSEAEKKQKSNPNPSKDNLFEHLG